MTLSFFFHLLHLTGFKGLLISEDESFVSKTVLAPRCMCSSIQISRNWITQWLLQSLIDCVKSTQLSQIQQNIPSNALKIERLFECAIKWKNSKCTIRINSNAIIFRSTFFTFTCLQRLLCFCPTNWNWCYQFCLFLCQEIPCEQWQMCSWAVSQPFARTHLPFFVHNWYPFINILNEFYVKLLLDKF